MLFALRDRLRLLAVIQTTNLKRAPPGGDAGMVQLSVRTLGRRGNTKDLVY